MDFETKFESSLLRPDGNGFRELVVYIEVVGRKYFHLIEDAEDASLVSIALLKPSERESIDEWAQACVEVAREWEPPKAWAHPTSDAFDGKNYLNWIMGGSR